MKKHIGILFSLLFAAGLWAQQPQTSLAPISAINAKYTQGVAPGYWPTAGSSLTLNLTSGTANCGGTIVTYVGGTLSMTGSTTNYVYLNTAASCVPATKTSAFTSSDIPIATVLTGSSITSINDDRTMFQEGNTSSVTNLPVCADTSGSGTAQLCTTSPSFTPVAGSTIVYKTTTANTGASLTLNVNSSSAASVSKWQGISVLTAGDVASNTPVVAVYDGAKWNLSTIANPPGSIGYATNLLGVSGILNTAIFSNNTSGTITLEAPSGVIGSTMLLLPVPVNSGEHIPQVVAAGTMALATSSIGSGACQTVTAGSVNSSAAANATTSDVIHWTPAVSLQGVTNYEVSTSGALSIDAYPTASYVNFNVCNWTSGSLTPGALTLNWEIIR